MSSLQVALTPQPQCPENSNDSFYPLGVFWFIQKRNDGLWSSVGAVLIRVTTSAGFFPSSETGDPRRINRFFSPGADGSKTVLRGKKQKRTLYTHQMAMFIAKIAEMTIKP